MANNTVDNRVVSIKFDNALFERKVADTIKALSQLDSSLKMSNGVTGLQNVAKEASKLDFRSVTDGIENVSGRFLAMAAVGVTTMSRITNAAIDTGSRMVKALSFAPIEDGFREYETNMNSIQTILSNTKAEGATLDDVNKKLQELNHYSDQTIYNFSEMARNIGTFTAAGVDLDTSVKSIKGIANLAAISGSNSEQAASAMYQLSQGIATGTLKLIDWNSVVNAGMGGEVFQKALWDTGKALGKITDSPVGQTFDEWKESGKSFRASLNDEWLTADVLTTTLQTLTGDLDAAQIEALGYSEEMAQQFYELGQNGKAAATEIKTITQLMSTVKESLGSGWSESFKLIIGDFGEAKNLLTDVNNVLGEMIGHIADVRNTKLIEWRDNGGRDAAIQALKNTFLSLVSAINLVREGFREVFPAKTGKELASFSKTIEKFSEKLIMSQETAAKFKEIFAGVFSVFAIGADVGKEILKFIGSFTSGAKTASTGALSFAQSVSETIQKFRDFLVEGGAISRFFAALRKDVDKARAWIKEFKDSLYGLFTPIKKDLEPTIKVIKDFRNNLPTKKDFSGITSISEAFDKLKTYFKKFENVPALEYLRDICDQLSERFSFLGTTIDGLKAFWDGFLKAVSAGSDIFSDILDSFSRFVVSLGETIKELLTPSDVSEAFDGLNIAILAGFGLILKKMYDKIKDFALGDSLVNQISGTLEKLTDTLSAMQASLRAEALMKIATAVGILTISITVLAALDPQKITKSLTAISVGFAQLVGVMALMAKISANVSVAARIGILAGAMILLAGAITILSVAILLLSTLDWEELGRGLTGVAGGLGVLVVATNLISTDAAGLIRAGISIGIISASLVILAAAVKAFSMLKWEELGRGLAGVAGGLLVLVTAMTFMPVSGMIRSSIAIGIMGASLLVLSLAVRAFADISWSEMGKGLLGIAGALTIMVFALNLLPPNLPLTAAGLIGVAIALKMMSTVVAIFGDMSWGELAKGLVMIAGLLLILAVGVTAMSGALVGAAAMIVVAHALGMLAEVLATLGEMDVGDIVKALVTVAAIFVVVGGLSMLLSSAIPFILGFGVALGALGLAFIAFGVAAFLFAKAFEMLADSGVEGGAALVSIITDMAKVIPLLIGKFVAGIIEAVIEIAKELPPLLEAIKKIISGLIDALIELIPKLAELIIKLVDKLVEVLTDALPKFVALGFLVLMSILDGLKDNIKEITKTVSQIITLFLDELAKHAQGMIDAGTELIANILLGISNNTEKIANAGTAVLTSFLDSISNNMIKITESVNKLIESFILCLWSFPTRIANVGTDALVKFLDALTADTDRIFTAINAFIASIIFGLASIPTTMAETGATALASFLDALTGDAVSVIEAITRLFTTILLSLALSGVQVVTYGTTLLTEFLKALTDNAEEVIKAVAKLITSITTELGLQAENIVTAGAKALTSFLGGLTANTVEIITAVKTVITTMITEIGNAATDIADAGAKALVNFLDGIGKNIDSVCKAAQDVIRKFAGCLGELGELIFGKGGEALGKFVGGVLGSLGEVTKVGASVLKELISSLASGLGNLMTEGANAATEFANGITNQLVSLGQGLYNTATNIAGDIIRGLVDGLTGGEGGVLNAAGNIATGLLSNMKGLLGINSPSKVAAEIGKNITEGLAIGLSKSGPALSESSNLSAQIMNAVIQTTSKLGADIAKITYSPKIKPTMDLAELNKGMDKLQALERFKDFHMRTRTLVADPMAQAQSENDNPEGLQKAWAPVFNQYNYSPRALSVSDVYRNTRSQIALAKKEL